ncbi:MAG: c-type cytochrome [Gammaproteobacteria bacterium]|nr:c-type cytochrome [Gammaproteobacteria bacterium]
MIKIWTMSLLLFAAPLAHAEDPDINWGKTLYTENCSGCHGFEGKGGTGVPIGLPGFINQVDDQYLGNTIRLGRQGRVMPSFSHLSQDQNHAIVAYMRSWTGVKAPHYSQKPIKGDPEKGSALFAKYCAGCHGANGEGGHGTGVTYSRPRELPIIAPALNNGGFLGSASDELIKHTIRYGREGTPMPAFRHNRELKSSDFNNLVSFIRQLKPVSPTEDLGNEPAYIVRESGSSFETTVENVKNAVASANMVLIRVQNIEDRLFSPKQVNNKQKIVYSCGFNFLYEAMKVDSRVGLFLPCRITIMQEEDKVRLYAMNPKRLSIYFNNDELQKLCGQMYDIYVSVLDEATM